MPETLTLETWQWFIGCVAWTLVGVVVGLFVAGRAKRDEPHAGLRVAHDYDGPPLLTMPEDPVLTERETNYVLARFMEWHHGRSAVLVLPAGWTVIVGRDWRPGPEVTPDAGDSD